MKIDPTIQPLGDLQNEPVTNAKKGTSRASDTKTTATSANSGDTIQISSRHAEVQHLTTQAAQVPDVRADRVAPLKAAVQQNSYKPDSGKIADAMLADTVSKGASA